MLTAELIRARTVKGKLRPAFVDPNDPDLRDRAIELIELFRHAIGDRRADIEEMLEGWMGDPTDPKLLRGLIHLVERRCEYTIDSQIPPHQLRQAVFREAAKRGPLAATRIEGGLPTAEDIFATVGAELNIDPTNMAQALYADHPDAMRLVTLDIPGSDDEKAADWLLHRYNVALVQALLISAPSLTLQLRRPPPPRVRQLFRAIKFHQLIHTIVPEGDDYRVVLDGPASLFSQTSRYGVALARFFPALLLQPGAWQLVSPLRWREQERILELDHEMGLRSHYRDTGAWVPKEAEWLAERFEQLQSGWELVRQTDPLRIGDVVVVPDFSFRKDGRIAHIEILGFWRKGSLAGRLALLDQPSAVNLLCAVSRRLCGDGEEQGLQGVLTFAEIIPAKEVLRWVEAHAIEEI